MTKHLNAKPPYKISTKLLRKSVSQTSALTLVAAVNILFLPQLQAETPPESTQISFKSLTYRDYQSSEDRINIDAQALLVEIPIAGKWSISANTVVDAISGASPKYHSSALTDINDDRNAYALAVSRYYPQASVTLGTAYSEEKDYLSRSYSLQNTFSTENQNTSLTTGISYTSDQILPNSIFLDSKKNKKVVDIALGLTQVMSQTDIVQANYRHSRGRGYYTDQYKLYDARPNARDSDSVLLRWNHYFAGTETTLRSSYRYYQDNFGIRSSTFDLEYVFTLADDWKITPLLRYYTQSAADFYYDPAANDPWSDQDTVGAPISVVYPLFVGGGTASMDQRLSEFGAITWGLKIEKPLSQKWTMDFKYEKYGQRSDWSINKGSPGLDNFSATSYQFGLNFSF